MCLFTQVNYWLFMVLVCCRCSSGVGACEESQSEMDGDVSVSLGVVDVEGSNSRPRRNLTLSQKGLESLELPTDSDS